VTYLEEKELTSLNISECFSPFFLIRESLLPKAQVRSCHVVDLHSHNNKPCKAYENINAKKDVSNRVGISEESAHHDESKSSKAENVECVIFELSARRSLKISENEKD
jgi:hypothetical protein